MTITVETYLVVALAFAVFAAVTALGSSLVLGAGFERLRAGFEIIKSQTGFFSDAIHGLDKRMDGVEKQGKYFFESIHKLEQKSSVPSGREEDVPARIEPQLISTSKSVDSNARPATPMLWSGMETKEIHFH